jgi:large subunit ribosomal protein L19
VPWRSIGDSKGLSSDLSHCEKFRDLIYIAMLVRSLTKLLRLRVRESASLQRSYTVDNPVTAKNWPPKRPKGEPVSITPEYCRKLIKELELGEMARLSKARPFQMPKLGLGDFVEVKYELSRSKQTFATMQGYVIKLKKKLLSTSFTLKGVYDGVGVEQTFPVYSPRLLDVKLIKSANVKPVNPLPYTRNYRYQWHTFIRHRHSEGKRVHWRLMRQNVGIQSLEPKIKLKLAVLRRRYNMQRIEAGLPPYIWQGPYQLTQRQGKDVRAEQLRRMLVYAFDERRQRAERRARMHGQNKFWRATIIAKMKRMKKFNPLPKYHPLSPGNLPK